MEAKAIRKEKETIYNNNNNNHNNKEKSYNYFSVG